MAVTDHEAPKTPDDWIAIAQRELANIRGAYIGGSSNDVKIDHALAAAEAMLKAIIWKHEGWRSWPAKKGNFNFLYKHNLEGLLDHTGLRTRLRMSNDHWLSWRVLVNASVRWSRYSPVSPPDDETHEVARSARHPDSGIVPWLLARYQEMTSH